MFALDCMTGFVIASCGEGAYTRRMEKTRENCVARATYGTVRGLGSLTKSVCKGFQGVGRFVGGGPKVLARFSGAVKPSTRKGESLSEREGIRSIVIEELLRRQGEEGSVINVDLRACFDKERHDLLPQKVAQRVHDAEVMYLLKQILQASGKRGVPVSLPKFEKRLRRMAETIETLQKTIAELCARGLPNETLVSTAITSVEGAEFLSDEERAVLTGIFRQNIAIQKPHRIDSAAGRIRSTVPRNPSFRSMLSKH